MYLELALCGSILFVITGALDWRQRNTEGSNTPQSQPDHPSEIPVGSRPPDDEESNGFRLQKIFPWLGYILAVILQIPLFLSILGVV